MDTRLRSEKIDGAASGEAGGGGEGGEGGGEGGDGGDRWQGTPPHAQHMQMCAHARHRSAATALLAPLRRTAAMPPW